MHDHDPSAALPSKNVTITRLACLKAAAELVASHAASEPDADAVLVVPEQFEAWAVRSM